MKKIFKCLIVFGILSTFLVESFTGVSAREVVNEGLQIIEVESPERIINTRSASETIVSRDKTTYYVKNSDMQLLKAKNQSIQIENLASATIKITNTFLKKTENYVDYYKLQTVQFYYSTKTSQYVFENVVARTRAVGYNGDGTFSNFYKDDNLGNIGTYYTFTKNVTSGYVQDVSGNAGAIVGGQTTWTLRDRSFNNVSSGLLINSQILWKGF